MTSPGFYLMHRGWQESAVFRNETYSRRDAFVWLIEQAAYVSRSVHAPKGVITIERGQLCHSSRYMAKAWKWDEAKVRRFLSALSTAEIIDAATDAGQFVITICNYDKYQSLSDGGDAATDAAATQQRRGGDANKNKGNKGNESSLAKANSPPARKRKADAEYVRLPEDWQPTRFSEGTAAREVVDRRGNGWAKVQLEDFKAWAANADDKPGKGRKLDWQAAFVKWINGQDRDGRNGTGRNGAGANNQPVDGFTRALRKVSATGSSDDF